MRFALLLLLAATASAAVAAWWVRPLSVARGLTRLEPREGERLKAVLRTAEIPAEAVRLVATTGEPCTSHRPHVLARWLRLDHATRTHCVGVRSRQVESLSLNGAALRDLSSLAELASLRHVRLRDGDLERIGPLDKECRWETLDVGRNRLRQLDGIEACTALTHLDVSQSRLRALPLAWLVDLKTLDASGNPIDDLASLRGLGRLTDLALRDLPLTDVSSIPPLSMLRRLELARTDVSFLDADTLARWPRLRWIGLAATPLEEVSGAYNVENALNTPTLRLEGDLRIGVNETPLAKRLKGEAVAMHDGMVEHSVDELPRGSGRWQGTDRRGRTRTGFGSALDVEGTAEWMTGAHSIAFDIDRGVSVTATAAIEVGRLRMYLRDGEGYVYAEAIPGRPLTIHAPLIAGTDTYFVYAEAVGGRVEGLRWSVRGTS